MIEAIVGALLELGGSYGFEIVCKATGIFTVGLILAYVAGHRAAYVRHLVLAAAFGAVLGVPLIVYTAPRFDLRLPVAAPLTAVSLPDMEPTAQLDPRQAANQYANEREIVPAQQLPGWQTSVRLVWFGGTILMLLPLVLDLWRLRRLRREGVPCSRLDARLNAFAAARGIRSRVELLLHPALGGPLTCGLLRPAILLPEDADSWDDEDLRRALVHELEHIRRADWGVHLMARAAVALYWFHPLAWMAWRKLTLNAECACDDAVLEHEESTAYAEQLVSLARRLTGASAQPALGMARRSDLSARVRSVLDPDQSRGRSTAPAATIALLAAVTVAGALGPLRALAQNPGQTGSLAAERTMAAPSGPLEQALFESAERGNMAEVERLLAAGANVNATLDGDGSPLIAAARRGHNAVVTLLLDRGADVNLAVEGDGSPLIMAARNRHLTTVRLLLDRGADIHMPVPGDGNALIMAARGGSVEVVDTLLNRGANIEQVVPGDENALIEASASGHLPVVKLLISRGANVNARVWVEASFNRPGEWRSPLGMALRNGHTAVADYLRSVGARQ